MPSPSKIILGVGRPNLRTNPVVIVTSVVSLATWSVTDLNGNIVISGAGLVATDTGAAGTDHIGRGTTATTTIGAAVNRYWEATATTIAGAAIGMGVMTSLEVFTSYLGSSAQSLSWYSDGSVYNNAGQVATWATYAQVDRLGIAVTGGGKIWGRVNNGNWNNDVIGNQNPATNTGGVAAPAGDLFPAYDLKGGSVWTANFGSTFVDTSPVGFSAFP